MSVVESSLLAERQVPAPQPANGRGDTKEKVAERDICTRITTRDLCRLARQLATLLKAGMPLVPALSALVEQLRNHPLGQILEGVRSSVNAGSTLADALNKYKHVFSPLFVSMVAAGESSGTLEYVLLRLAEMLEKRVHLVSKVKSAIAYPVMMVVVAVGVVVFLMSVVVPSITQIFLEMNRNLPWPTRLLIAASALLQTYFMLIAIVICAALFAASAWMKTKDGRFFVDRLKLKLPLFGTLFLKLEIARLARTLGTLLAGGVPILGALKIAKGVVQNSFITDALDSVRELVSKGDDLAGAVRRTGLFPPIVFHTLATGQISGNVEDGLLNIADMYDGEVELTAKTLTSLLEPAILLIMGAIIGFIVLAILLPIFEINQVL